MKPTVVIGMAAAALLSTSSAAGLVRTDVALKRGATEQVSLDFLAGDWALRDTTGAAVGSSRIVVQAPGAMLFEQRTVGGSPPQPLWFKNAEGTGWAQLFISPDRSVREFTLQSPAGVWPLVMGADLITRDGQRVRYKLTIWRKDVNESRRRLDQSRDEGKTWSAVLDLTYIRTR